jgi:hypothetical protein
MNKIINILVGVLYILSITMLFSIHRLDKDTKELKNQIIMLKVINQIKAKERL